MLLLSFDRSISGITRHSRDITQILSRFDSSFKRGPIPKGSISTHIDFGGLRLNMREFHRALVLGTTKTKRKKNIHTQTNLSTKITVDKSTQFNGYDSDETPDLNFSSDMHNSETD